MLHAHVIKRAHESVVPTPRMLRHWWARLNAEVFDGVLYPCLLTYGPSEYPDADGLCYPLENRRVRIHVRETGWTRGGMLSVLAHEMVHQYQHQHGEPLTHGEVFKHYATNIEAITGLTI